MWIGFSMAFLYGPIVFFDDRTAFLFVIRTLGINAVIFYLNILILLPLLLERNKIITYILSVIVLLSLVTFSLEVTDPVKPEIWKRIRQNKEQERFESVIAESENKVMGSRDVRPQIPVRPLRREKELVPRRFLFNLFPSLGILFLSTLFWVVLESKRKEKAQLSLTNQNLETEMKFLKSQMNPHFLFNALNNIYALSQQGHTKTSQLILKLSSMLRFIVYETDGRKIPIGQEVEYINDYIEFQKIKLDFEPNLEVTFTHVDYQTRIEPMLIFPFVENAFKHGNIDDQRNGWVKMSLKTTEGLMTFQITNSKPSRPASKDRSRGIGIENIRKRLAVLYDNRYQLDISNMEDVFEVKLFIGTL